MKGKGKGKGKSESYDEKSARLAAEVEYLQQVQAGHLGSSQWWPGSGAKSSGKGHAHQGKGSGKQGQWQRQPHDNRQSRRRNRSRSMSRGRSTTPKSGKRGSTPRTKSRSRSASVRRKDKAKKDQDDAAEERKRKAEEKKKQRQVERDARNGGPRPTKPCPNCLSEITYATSKRCFECKEPFLPDAVAATAAPNPPAAAAQLATPTGEAAVQYLQSATKAMDKVKTLSFAEVAQKPAAPAPAAAAAASASPPAAANPATGSPTADAQATVIDVDAADAEAAAAAAKQLVSLRAQRATSESQRIAYVGTPHLQQAFASHVTDLDTQIAKIVGARQAALAPHQLGHIVGQRQLEVSVAMREASETKEKTIVRLKSFDDYVKQVSDDFAIRMQALVDAQKAAADGFTAERAALVADHAADEQAAQAKLDAANALLKQALELQKVQQSAPRAMQVDGAAASGCNSPPAPAADTLPAGTTAPPVTPATPTVAEVAAQVATADANSIAQKVVQQADQIKELQQKLLAASNAAIAAQSAAPAAVPATPATIMAMPTLPEPKPVDDSEMSSYALTMQTLEHHAIQDASFPMYFKYLAIRPIQVAKIVGAQLWTEFYPKDPPSLELAIPRRLLGALNVGIARLAICTEAYANVPAEKVKEAVDSSAAAYHEHRQTQLGKEIAPY